MSKELTSKQRQFIAEYLKDSNATQAAIRAGYSPKTAQEQSSRLLKQPEIREIICERGREMARKAAVDTEWVLREMRRNYDLALADGRYGDAIRVLTLLDKRQQAIDLLEIPEETKIYVDTGLPPFSPGSADPSSPFHEDYLNQVRRIKEFARCISLDEELAAHQHRLNPYERPTNAGQTENNLDEA